MKRDAQGYSIDSSILKKAEKRGHIALGIAFAEGRGVRLTADQVWHLVAGDEAIASAIYNMQEDIQGGPYE